MNPIASRQPKGLYSLFLTELWERFGFYTVQTILVLYLISKLGYSDKSAYLLYGTFSSLLYLTPFIGGFLADRYLGFRRCVILGGILLCIGYAIMGLPSVKALFIGLSIIIAGNGLFKPNVSSLLGSFYRGTDPRREGGFTIFYMGINIGGMLPPLFIGAFVAAYSWGSGFLLAALGMVFSLSIFFFTRKLLEKQGNIPEKSPLRAKKNKKFYGWLFLGIIASIALCHLLFYYPEEADFFLIVATLAILGTLLFFLFKERADQRKKLIACLILIALSIGFWAIYMQTFTSLILFAQRNIHKEIFGIPINAEFTLFFNPFFIIALSPLFSRLWTWLEMKRINPSIPFKFSLGILCIGIGFLVLSIGTRCCNTDGIASLWWLICSYFIQTIGELLLSPIGLAMITRLAPARLVGTMMGVWFMTLAAAFAIGGPLATLANIPKGTPTAQSLVIYDHAFLIYAGIALTLTVLSFSLVPYLKRLIEIPSLPIRTPKA